MHKKREGNYLLFPQNVRRGVQEPYREAAIGQKVSPQDGIRVEQRQTVLVPRPCITVATKFILQTDLNVLFCQWRLHHYGIRWRGPCSEGT